MARLMTAYPGMTPAVFWSLTLEEFNALIEYAKERGREE